MPPLTTPPSPTPHKPRIVIYHQTHHTAAPTSIPISILPLLPTASTPLLTHLIIAAIHLNSSPTALTLNNDAPSHPKFDTLWQEIAILQTAGVKILGMLGGAAKGSYRRLDIEDEEIFEAYYAPLHDLIQERRFDGLDLDVEESMSLRGIVRLIDRLVADFGPEFIITLAPVARALQGLPHLSGFSYEELERARGDRIAWYNVQFYNGWGWLDTFGDYDLILKKGWKREKVVVGVLTSRTLGRGYVEWEELRRTMRVFGQFYERFGGVMGWEYFCSEPGGEERPWEWAGGMGACLGVE